MMIGVTGGNGLLGSFILRRLLESNLPFIAFKRDASDLSLVKDINDKITWRNADINDPVSLSEAFDGITHIIHTAAVVSFNPRHSKTMFATNVDGTRHVVNACLNEGVKRLVHVSSVAALGRTKNQAYVTEENKWVDSPVNSAYAHSKYLAELEIFRAQEEGLSTVIINPSVILAPTQWDRSSSQLFKYVGQENKFYINGTLNYVDVRDVANVAYKLLHSPEQNERFIVSSGQISFKDFFSEVAFLLNKKAPSIKLTKPYVKILAFIEAIRSMITGSNPLITKETARFTDITITYDNTKIKKRLNFDFLPFSSTLQWCCEHYSKKINDKK